MFFHSNEMRHKQDTTARLDDLIRLYLKFVLRRGEILNLLSRVDDINITMCTFENAEGGF